MLTIEIIVMKIMKCQFIFECIQVTPYVLGVFTDWRRTAKSIVLQNIFIF